MFLRGGLIIEFSGECGGEEVLEVFIRLSGFEEHISLSFGVFGGEL